MTGSGQEQPTEGGFGNEPRGTQKMKLTIPRGGTGGIVGQAPEQACRARGTGRSRGPSCEGPKKFCRTGLRHRP